MEKIRQLGEERISRLIVKYSAPAIAGMVIYGLNRIVGNIFIGRFLGVEPLAGFTVANTLVLIIIAFVMLMGSGSSALISILLGQKKPEEATRTLDNALVVSALFSLPLMAAGLFLTEPLLRLFGGDGASLVHGASFLRVFALGTFFQFANTVLNSAIRAEGQPMKALMTNIVSFAGTTVLTPVFLLLFPLGIAGVGVAMVVSQFLVMLWLGGHFLGKATALRLRRTSLVLSGNLVRRMLAIGTAPFSMQFLGACLSIVTNHLVVRQAGQTGLAVMGVVFSLYFLLIMPLQGTSNGIQPIIGYNHGAGLRQRVRRTVTLSLAFVTILCVFEFAVVIVFRSALSALFLSGQPEILALCSHGLLLALLAMPIVGLQFIAGSYFQSVGLARQAIAINLFRSLFILVPLATLPLAWGFDGIFLSYPVTDALVALLCAALLWRQARRPAAVPAS